ncbi:hypothetical protein T06_10207 [Trichinella sp. T6]|nr:hypothetical protein T06_10207 [Trichinella sp. T6]
MADISELRFVTNRGGSTSLVSQGRTYKLRYTNKQRKHWVCSKGREGCKGVIWTNLDVTYVITQKDHIESCPVDEHLAYKMEKKAVLKKRSAEETKSILAIYDEVSVASAVPSTFGYFPPSRRIIFKRVKSTMYSHRSKRYLKLPEHRRDQQIPDAFRTTMAGEDFLLWQSASSHILVLATGSNIRLMATRRTWALDGTFKIVPQWYQQLFTIHAFLAGKLVLAVYCLCTDKDIPTYGNLNEKVEDGSEEGTSPVGIHLSSTEGQTAIRLPVVRAMAHGEKGKKKLVNCLLDIGSERSLIRSDVADELELQGPTRAMTVKGVNGLHVRIADVRRVQFRLTPIPSKGLEPFNEGIELTALSLPNLCDDLVATPTPWFCKDKILIDIIIGLDAYFQVLGQGVRRGGPNDPAAIETIFGWIVCGPTTRQAANREATTLLAQTKDRLSRLLRRFWEVEALGILPATEDAKAEPALTRFEESVSFDGQRYSVVLLWKSGASPLRNNLEVAKRRLRSLRHRLARDPDKEREYADVIQSYLDQGWAEEVPDESGPIDSTWDLPHHAVYQGGPGKAKCRVVFDGSAEMNGASLNHCLEPGPKLQPDLVAVLLRFRRSRIGIQADIEKMYLQVN